MKLEHEADDGRSQQKSRILSFSSRLLVDANREEDDGDRIQSDEDSNSGSLIRRAERTASRDQNVEGEEVEQDRSSILQPFTSASRSPTSIQGGPLNININSIDKSSVSIDFRSFMYEPSPHHQNYGQTSFRKRQSSAVEVDADTTSPAMCFGSPGPIISKDNDDQ